MNKEQDTAMALKLTCNLVYQRGGLTEQGNGPHIKISQTVSAIMNASRNWKTYNIAHQYAISVPPISCTFFQDMKIIGTIEFGSDRAISTISPQDTAEIICLLHHAIDEQMRDNAAALARITANQICATEHEHPQPVRTAWPSNQWSTFTRMPIEAN